MELQFAIGTRIFFLLLNINSVGGFPTHKERERKEKTWGTSSLPTTHRIYTKRRHNNNFSPLASPHTFTNFFSVRSPLSPSLSHTHSLCVARAHTLFTTLQLLTLIFQLLPFWLWREPRFFLFYFCCCRRFVIFSSLPCSLVNVVFHLRSLRWWCLRHRRRVFAAAFAFLWYPKSLRVLRSPKGAHSRVSFCSLAFGASS